MISIYLAGPDVFKPNAKEVGKELVRLCEKSGFKGNFPLDNEIDGNFSRTVLGEKIAEANRQMIIASDVVLANLEPFRGPSADVGTVWECAFAKGLGKKVYGYNLPQSYYKHRVIGKMPHDGLLIEDWGVFDNIMIAYGLDNTFLGIISALEYLKSKNEKGEL